MVEIDTFSHYTDLANPDPAQNVTPTGETFPEGGENPSND